MSTADKVTIGILVAQVIGVAGILIVNRAIGRRR